MCGVQVAVGDVQVAVFGVQVAVCDLQVAVCGVRVAACHIAVYESPHYLCKFLIKSSSSTFGQEMVLIRDKVSAEQKLVLLFGTALAFSISA